MVESGAEHQGHQFQYQLIAAILYFLQNDYDELLLEGKNYEDSIFKKRGKSKFAIGEAKSIHSTTKTNWTAEALHYSGVIKGPFLQLWNRRNKSYKEGRTFDFILFTTIPLNESIFDETLQELEIPEDEYDKIIEKCQKNFKKLENDNFKFSKQNIKEFDQNIKIIIMSMEQIKIRIIEHIRSQLDTNVKLSNKNFEALYSFFSSPAYRAGDWISREELLGKLIGRDTEILTELTSARSEEINFRFKFDVKKRLGSSYRNNLRGLSMTNLTSESIKDIKIENFEYDRRINSKYPKRESIEAFENQVKSKFEGSYKESEDRFFEIQFNYAKHVRSIEISYQDKYSDERRKLKLNTENLPNN